MLALKTSSFMIASVAALLARHSACGVGRLFSDLSFGTLSFGTLANKKSCQNTICYCSGFLKRPKPDRDQLDQSLKSMARMALCWRAMRQARHGISQIIPLDLAQ